MSQLRQIIHVSGYETGTTTVTDEEELRKLRKERDSLIEALREQSAAGRNTCPWVYELMEEMYCSYQADMEDEPAILFEDYVEIVTAEKGGVKAILMQAGIIEPV